MTQLEFLRKNFRRIGELTQRQALIEFGIGSCSRRMCDLMKEGFVIAKIKRRAKSRWEKPTFITVYKFISAPKKRGA